MAIIKLYKGQKDEVLVWNVEDVMQLRSRYHIVGKAIGSHPCMPRQNNILSRPVLLSPYEVTLLLEKGFGQLCSLDELHGEELDKRRQQQLEQHEASLTEQRKLAREQKRNDVMSRSTEIVSGIAKKQGKSGALSAEDKAAIVDDILDKIQPIKEQHMLVQQTIEAPVNSPKSDAEWTFPHNESERINYLVFKDLWEQQMTLTPGAKFGGNFLVYPGDPELYHAKYIAVCLKCDDEMQPTDIVQMSRLASNVKKTALVCRVETATDKVVYYKLNYNPR